MALRETITTHKHTAAGCFKNSTHFSSLQQDLPLLLVLPLLLHPLQLLEEAQLRADVGVLLVVLVVLTGDRGSEQR